LTDSQVLLESSEVIFSYVIIILISYARVSTTEQVLNLQTDALLSAEGILSQARKRSWWVRGAIA
jgi:hypothetical protein